MTSTCPYCGTSFIPRINQKYCTPQCTNRVKNERQGARLESTATCEWCSCTFHPTARNPDARFCTPGCAGKGARSKYAKARIRVATDSSGEREPLGAFDVVRREDGTLEKVRVR